MRYYIYFHYREDCEFPFYIGKGQGNRVYESRCGDPQRCYTCRVRCHKCSTILYCQANDIAVWSDWPIFETDDGDEINQAETAWIAFCREHRLHNADMSDLYVGRCNQYKGWRRLTDEEYNYYKLLQEGE